ncbi:retrotransposon ty3-gypsy subclass, partial [Cystoisospora suis]
MMRTINRHKETSERRQLRKKRERIKFEVSESDSNVEETNQRERKNPRKRRITLEKALVMKNPKGQQDNSSPKEEPTGDPEDLPFKSSTAVEEALGTFKIEGSKENRTRGRKKNSVSRVELVPLKKVRKEMRQHQIEIIGFIKIEPLEEFRGEEGKASKLLGQHKKPSERIKKMGGTLDEDTANLVDDFQEVFEELPPIGVCERPTKHQIKLIPGEVPRYPTRNYNLSSDDLAELKRQSKDLLEKKFIEPTQAPFAAPVFLVPKPGGEGLRMVVDYKALNKITIKDECPLPRIQDLIQRLGKAQWFTKLELQNGYYQVQVAPEDRWKTAFKCREKSQLVWRPKHSQAVKELKDALINVTMTNIFNPDLPLVIKTDASKYAVGAVLEQDGKPIAFESRKKLGHEHFIGIRPATIETDHVTLSRMLTQKKVTSRLGYWLDKLADFNFQVLYKPGKQNLVADALSRRPDYMERVVMLMESQRPRMNSRRAPGETARLNWEKAYNNCEDFKEIVKTCKELGVDEDTGKFIPLIERGRVYHWKDNLLWVRVREGWRLCTPTKDKRLEVLQGFHDDFLAGHPGIDKTIADIEKIFWWPNMRGEIE